MSRSCGMPPRPLRLENGPKRGARPLSAGLHATLELFGVKVEPARVPAVLEFKSSRRKVFQMRQPAIEVIAAFHRLLPGMRSRRGRRNTPIAAISAFADQIPAQTGTVPWRANPAPTVNTR